VSSTAGDSFSITVTALDGGDAVDTGYLGTVNLTSSDVQAVLPADYTFTPGDSGVAVITGVTLRTTGNQTVTATDVANASITGTSGPVAVAPGPLGSFVFGTVADQTAGTASGSIAIQAKDTFGNDKTDYNDSPSLTGNLGTAPIGCSGPCPPDYDGDGIVSFSGGTASATFTAYVTGTGQQLTLTDTGPDPDVVSDSNTFTVNPGPLGSFTIGTISNQTAGTPFSVTATAYDVYGNLKDDYAGGATLAGTPGSSPGNSTRGCGVGNGSPCLPSYDPFGPWTNGVASALVTAFKAETGRSVTATDGTSTGTSNMFDVGPNVHMVPPTRFNQQPTLTQFNVSISPAVQVTVEDFWGNPRQGDTVTITIGTNPSDGTLSGDVAEDTDASGIATFEDLSINNVGVGYTLVATVNPPAPTISFTSDPFDVANQVTPCTGSTCSATGTTGSVTSTVTADDLGGGAFASVFGPAAIASLGPARLGVTVAGSIDIPAGVCGTGPTPFTQYGEGFASTSIKSPGDQPSFKIVARLDKAVVRTKPGNPGATKWDICLGAINVLNPPVGLPNGYVPSPSECNEPAVDISWRTKDGSCAIFKDGYFWGLLASYQSKVKSCPISPGSGLFPGVLSKMKDNAGDLVITSCVPYSYDEKGGFG
jgi:hypothetical protein